VGSKACLLCQNIIFTEIHYHPVKDNYGHFVEIKNVGNVSVVMTGATIKGMSTFLITLTARLGPIHLSATHSCTSTILGCGLLY
jgi:hypothetical protein